MLKSFPRDMVSIESFAYIYDDELKKGTLVAFLVYSPGGTIVYLHKEGYDIHEILLAGEAYFGQTLVCRRYKVYRCEILPEA